MLILLKTVRVDFMFMNKHCRNNMENEKLFFFLNVII